MNEQLSMLLLEQSGWPDGIAVLKVGEWAPGIDAFICPPDKKGPEPCECGFVGIWERRPIFGWHGYNPGRVESYSDAALAQKGGWLVAIGFDERCPGCGDIERFDEWANFRERLIEAAPVIQLGQSVVPE